MSKNLDRFVLLWCGLSGFATYEHYKMSKCGVGSQPPIWYKSALYGFTVGPLYIMKDTLNWYKSNIKFMLFNYLEKTPEKDIGKAEPDLESIPDIEAKSKIDLN